MATYTIRFFLVHSLFGAIGETSPNSYRHCGQLHVTVLPFTPQTLPAAQSDAAQVQASGLSVQGLVTHWYKTPAPLDLCTQTWPGMHIDAPHGTAAQVLDTVDHTSFTHVASMLFAAVAHW